MAKQFVDPEDTTLDGVIKMMENEEWNCIHCKHYFGKKGVRQTCAAFPDGIPTSIYLGQVVHDKRMFKQKNNLIFEGK